MTDTASYPPRLVRDLMTVGVQTCAPDTPLTEIIAVLMAKNLEELVVTEEGQNVGVVGYEQIAAAYASRKNWEGLKAEDVMRTGVPSVPADIPITAAAQLMCDQKVRVLYVTHHAGGIEYPAAMIGFYHLARHMAARSAEDLSDLGTQAQRKPPLDLFFQRRDEARRRSQRRD